MNYGNRRLHIGADDVHQAGEKDTVSKQNREEVHRRNAGDGKEGPLHKHPAVAAITC